MSETKPTLIPAPSDEQYVEFGKYIAAYLGASPDWNGGDVCAIASEAAGRILQYEIGSPDVLPFWRARAAELGIEIDDEDVCADATCFESLDDGEGSDGFCGQHADERYCADCDEMFPDRNDRDAHTCDNA
ncbi:MAG: hypothetical protein V4755_07600 [Curtobacterium sp.]